jgi:hypothetical protein
MLKNSLYKAIGKIKINKIGVNIRGLRSRQIGNLDIGISRKGL